MEKTAAAQYKRNRKAVDSLSADLAFLVKQHAKKQAEKSFDWGYPGDLGHVADLLEQAVRFLNHGELMQSLPGRPVGTYPARDRQGRPIRVTVPTD